MAVDIVADSIEAGCPFLRAIDTQSDPYRRKTEHGNYQSRNGNKVHDVTLNGQPLMRCLEADITRRKPLTPIA